MANTSSSSRHRDEERTIGQAASDVKNKAKEAGATVADKAKDAASGFVEQAKDTASSVASSIGERAEQATSNVGSGMQSLAGTIRDKAPQGGMVGSAASSVASALEKGGRYLEEEGLSGVGEDLTSLIRRNPIPAMLVGIGIGYLIARATRS